MSHHIIGIVFSISVSFHQAFGFSFLLLLTPVLFFLTLQKPKLQTSQFYLKTVDEKKVNFKKSTAT